MADSDWKYVQRNKTNGQYRTTEEGGGGGGDISDVTLDGISVVNQNGVAVLTTPDGDDIPYDNTTSGMTATDLQGAIDELAQDFQDGCNTISQAVIAKGQTPASNSPSDIAYAISQIQTGGGGVLNIFDYEQQKIVKGDTSYKFETDCLLKSGLSVSDFTVSANITAVTYNDTLHFTVTMNISGGDQSISIQANSGAFKNNNGTSITFSKIIEVLDTFTQLFGDHKHMDFLVNSTWVDSGTTNFTVDGHTYYINSDSWINRDSNNGNENVSLWINKRDSSYYIIKKQFYEWGTLKFVKIWWEGSALFNARPQDQIYELYYLYKDDWGEFYDVMLHLNKVSSSYNNGTKKMLATSFSMSMSNPTISFYRNSRIYKTFDIVYDVYDEALHKTEYLAYKMVVGAIEDLVGDYDNTNGAWDMYNFGRQDSGAGPYTFPTYFRVGWIIPTLNAELTSMYFGGDSYVRLNNNSSYTITMLQRDSSVYYGWYCRVKCTDLNDLEALRVVWGGSATWNGTIDRYWEMWFFANGDAMVYVKSIGNQTGSGTSFLGVSFTPAAGGYYSFYRQQDATFVLENAKYHL